MEQQINTVAALKAASEAQKQMLAAANIGDMEDLMDDMADMMADMDEINEVMGRTYNVEMNENDLLAELNELDVEIANEQFEGSAMPNYIPTSQKANSNLEAGGVDDDEALRNLMKTD